jgi:putative glutamine amidotransferase
MRSHYLWRRNEQFRINAALTDYSAFAYIELEVNRPLKWVGEVIVKKDSELTQRPRIAVAASLEKARWTFWDREAFLLPSSYVSAVQEAGGFALMVPPDKELIDDPDELLDAVDALVLVGGSDIDPTLYDESPHEETVDVRRSRDRFELALTKAAVERDMPFLGICRGMQILNVAQGGTLIQHLPDDVGHEDHRRSLGSFDNAAHDVRLKPGSLAARAADETVHKTMSHHHQGIDQIGEGLVASGWSVLDDLVEAIEMPDRRFVLGVQWHCEADPDSKIISALVEAARARKLVAG